MTLHVDKKPATAAKAKGSDAGTISMLCLQGVSFVIEGRTLLHPLTLDFEAGKTVGLIGHNGSGKSTLLKLLARQQQPSSGTIRFEGKALAEWPGRAFARRLGYLPQQTPAAPGMLVKELVALGRYPWHGALDRFAEADRTKASEALELTGTASLAGRLVDTLSGGERQRVWLAMLVAQDADCLLLDEPISALDIGHQLEVLALTQTLAREKGLSVLAVLHDVNMAARFCDEIVALHSGRLIRWLAVLPLGETVSRSLGLGVVAVRAILLCLIAIPTAVATLLIGPLSFVGLMAPHFARMTAFRRPAGEIFASALYGALILIAADWAGRTIIFPWQIPAGLLTALAGGPFFLIAMSRSR